jgi:hypothetical protein
LARKLRIAAIIVHTVMKPNPNANPMMVALPNGVPLFSGLLAVVDGELIAEVEDGDDPFIVVGGFVIWVSAV